MICYYVPSLRYSSSSEGFLREDLVLLFLILCAGNQHVFEGGETRQYTSSKPTYRVPFSRSQHSCPNFVGKHSLELLHEAIREPFEQGVASAQDDLVVKSHAEIDVHLGKTVLQELDDRFV